MIEDQHARAALSATSDGALFIITEDTDSRLRRQQLICEIDDVTVVERIAALEADLIEAEQRAGGR